MTRHLRRHYRVVRRLPWIEGGKPAPGFQWEGGRAVVYEPGQLVQVDDRELGGIYHRLEALDDDGRAALEAVRSQAEAPAQRTAIADLHPKAVEWLSRAMEEGLRARGRLRDLCIWLIARGDDPTGDDLAGALEESPGEPLPEKLCEYLAKLLRGQVQRKSGRKAPPRTTGQDLHVQSFYHLAVEELTVRFAHERRPPIRRMTAAQVADALGLSVRTVQRIVRRRPWTKDGKGVADV